MERIQKVIAESGIASRRKAEQLILEGKVYVNGKLAEIGQKVSGNDEIVVNGNKIKKEDKVYFLLNKPRSVICSNDDPEKRKSVVDLIQTDKRIYPIGRLDYDTTGAIILTNDGELANILMHPKNEIERVYYAKVEGFVTKDELNRLRKGILIDNKMCKVYNAKMKKYNKASDKSYVSITLKEGHNHEVKNIFASINHPVVKLKREVFAGFDITNMKSGEYRLLNPKEVKLLYAYKK